MKIGHGRKGNGQKLQLIPELVIPQRQQGKKEKDFLTQSPGS